jgi:hypothetical protein
MSLDRARRSRKHKIDEKKKPIVPHQLQSFKDEEFQQIVQALNELLSKKDPDTFNSSWLQSNAPRCYRFIWKNIRNVFGDVDWDRVTCALERRFQRRWMPKRSRRANAPYRDRAEVMLALKEHHAKLYVFLAQNDPADGRIREIISVTLVRLAQHGNISATHEIMRLIGYTIEDWIERHHFLSRWREYGTEMRLNLERCIRRYRYSGSFLKYVYRTLEYAGRGIRPLQARSLDEPIFNGTLRRIETIGRDPETNTLTI